MDDLRLVHTSEIEINGDQYEVRVYCRDDGKHFAKTHFGDGDYIINDGLSLAEVLSKNTKLLPLAVSSRQVLHDYRGVAPANQSTLDS